MNYIKELNAFYDQQETNPLSASAVAVWHALMHICNKAGWPVDFTVAVSVVTLKAGVKERSFYNARNELKQKGYLTFSSRKGNQAAIYTLTSLSALFTDKLADTNAHSLAYNSADNVSPLLKQNQLKQNEHKNNPFHFYEANGFGMLTPFISEAINGWLTDDSFKEAEAVVIEAMKIAVIKNIRNWRYINKILQDWNSRQLLTVSDVLAEQEKWNKRVTPFPAVKKGGKAHDTRKQSPATDYSSYDFGF